ncbi:MAG: radical SAM protein, partial [Marinosulfonomonas sp.]|nr:radical SAM protein [Marinosulfonomonas sp.]
MLNSDQTLPPNLRRPGRASQSNHVGRFEAHQRVVASDGWDIEEDAQLSRTEISYERPRRVITRNTSPDLSNGRSGEVLRVM